MSNDEEFSSVTAGLSKCSGGTVGQHDYCSVGCQCVAGEGDCDWDGECTAGNICGLNNGDKFGRNTAEDVCWPPHCQNGTLDGDETSLDCGGSCGTVCVCDTGMNGDPEFCTASCKCDVGEGDCDTADDCDQTTVAQTCVANMGAAFGQDPSNGICLPTHCVNSAQDGDETGVDCGGSCAACAAADFDRVSEIPAEINARVQLGYDVSSDGRYVVFASVADNLVAGDTNGRTDVFFVDTQLLTIELASVRSAGGFGDGHSYWASVSSTGRYVVFMSDSTDMVAGDTNGVDDIFVRDRTAGTTTRVSVNAGGGQSSVASQFPDISGNGTWVSFVSASSDLVGGDTNGVSDVFLTRWSANAIQRVSVGPAGAQADGPSSDAHLDANGRYVVYSSTATNLVTGDTNGVSDIFVRDRSLGSTTRVSLPSDAGIAEPNQASIYPEISSSGAYITYRSFASNLVTGDTNGTWDVFWVQRGTRATERVSVDTAGVEADSASLYSAVDQTGRFIAFSSNASNLVAGDTNASRDIFLRDRVSGITTRVDNGVTPNARSQRPCISADASRVIFRSEATNLVAGDLNGEFDLFSGEL